MKSNELTVGLLRRQAIADAHRELRVELVIFANEATIDEATIASRERVR